MLPPSCLDGSITRVGPGQNPQYTRAHFGGEAVGLLTRTPTHNNESKKTQHNKNMVAEPVLCDLSVRRSARGALLITKQHFNLNDD